MTTLPVLFISHGAPSFVIEDTPARAFLGQLGTALPRPRAILAISAHWGTEQPIVGSAAQPGTIHDFYGFPRVLYTLRYPAAGSPELAERTADLLKAADLPVREDAERGYDHGVWTPLMLMYP